MTAQTQQSEGGDGLDRGPHASGRERLCIATRAVRPISELIRFVVGPEDETVPDIKCKLPGRGVWVTATREALENAIARRAFARGFKRNVRLPADLPERTERLLRAASLDALAIAGKGGLVVAGFAKVAAALEREPVIALVRAAEAAPDGVRKLDGIAKSQGKSLPVLGFLTSAELDLALNRPNVIHAALLAGSASDTFLARSRRLEHYRAGDAGDRSNQTGDGAAHRAGRLYGCV
jgi:uncharacterized protein